MTGAAPLVRSLVKGLVATVACVAVVAASGDDVQDPIRFAETSEIVPAPSTETVPSPTPERADTGPWSKPVDVPNPARFAESFQLVPESLTPESSVATVVSVTPENIAYLVTVTM